MIQSRTQTKMIAPSYAPLIKPVFGGLLSVRSQLFLWFHGLSKYVQATSNVPYEEHTAMYSSCRIDFITIEFRGQESSWR